MKKFIPVFFLLLFGYILPAQELPQRTVVPVPFELHQAATIFIPLETVTPFLAYSLTWEGTGEEIAIRFSEDGERWEDWQVLHRDPHSIHETKSDTKVSELGFTSSGMRFFQLQPGSGYFEQIMGHFYSPGDSPEPRAREPMELDLSSSCSCQQPEYQDRSDWCPAGNCPPNSSPLYTAVTHLIVHHSAGTNESSDWAAVVRSIWDYHVNSNGWADIGYNWLIDPNGVLYEGRGDNVLGAHFCGTNSGTMGVCVLGNFQLVEPSGEAKTTLKELLAWKACEEDINPLTAVYHPSSGLILKTISGHRDGCATLCPGDLLYNELINT